MYFACVCVEKLWKDKQGSNNSDKQIGKYSRTRNRKWERLGSGMYTMSFFSQINIWGL